MSNSQASLTNLESMLKAAEAESSLMSASEQNTTESKSLVTNPTESTESVAKIIESVANANTVHIDNLPKLPDNSNPPPNIADKVKAALNSTNIVAMLNRMSNNPDEVSKMMEQSMGQMTPDMMEQVRRMAMGGQGQQVLQEMRRRGLDPNAMRSQLLEQQRAIRGMSANNDNTRLAVLITASRQLKMCNIPLGSVQPAVANIIKSGEPVELSCSRIALGPLAGKTIKVWCDPSRKGKNKRLSKIVGFHVAGEGVVIMDDGDLTEKDFLAAERLVD